MAFLPLKPITMKERVSMIFVYYGRIDVKDGAFVVIDKNGVRKHIPVGSVACIMLARTRHPRLPRRRAAGRPGGYAAGLGGRRGSLGENRRMPIDHDGLRLVEFFSGRRGENAITALFNKLKSFKIKGLLKSSINRKIGRFFQPDFYL